MASSARGALAPFVAGSTRSVMRLSFKLLPSAPKMRYAAVAAVFVHKAALETPSPPEVIAKTFNLTPSELRVLLGIVEVGGVPETAEALGVAETTVKTHLRRLYAKTGTGRQAELVKLVAGFANPLVG